MLSLTDTFSKEAYWRINDEQVAGKPVAPYQACVGYFSALTFVTFKESINYATSILVLGLSSLLKCWDSFKSTSTTFPFSADNKLLSFYACTKLLLNDAPLIRLRWPWLLNISRWFHAILIPTAKPVRWFPVVVSDERRHSSITNNFDPDWWISDHF